MKKLITELTVITVMLLLGVWNVNGQTGSILLETNFENWKPTIGVDQANGTYSVPDASLKIQGPKFNNSSTPNAGTVGYPNYFRFGSAGSTTNQFIEVTPSKEFVNGGRITVVISTNSNAGATDVFSIADGPSASTDISKTFANFNQIGKVHTTVSVDLPTDYTGIKTIRLFRTATTTFLHYLKIETNPAAPTISAFEVAGVTATIDESAKTITAELPFGTIITALTPTVTLGGTATSYTPTGVQDFTNPVVYTATDGTNNVDYTVALSVPAAPPAPTITLDSGSTVQALKTGTAITDIVYEITNGTGASVTGLPAGVTGTWASTGTNQGTYTISGTVDAGVAANAYGFTVTATPISGYVGDDVTVAGTITVKSATALNVLYLNGAVAVASTDIVYPHLNTSPDYILEIKAAAGTAPAATVYDTYDLIIVHESVAGANAELAALKNVDKPILNFKSFAYNSGRWSWGAGDNGLATNKDITVKQPSHPIFTDISGAALDATLELISAVVASKGIQPADVTLLGSINVATAPKASGVGVAIHDVPASVRGVDTSKYLMIPIFSDSYQHMTATTLKMVDNAIEYLLNGTQFAPPSLEISTFKVGATSGIINHEAETITLSVPMETDLSAITPEIYLAGEGTSVTPATAKDFSNGPVTYTVSDMINSKNYVVTIIQTGSSISSLLDFDVTFDGKTIHNPKQISLQVFDVAGRSIISSNQNIKMNDKQKGIYIIKSDTRAMKINVR